mgnify:CR=1 FL=1
MKKLNKKGVTLIELIVSFAIVSIAMIYFYQTIVDLHRMYKNSNKATDEFVNKDYALRVLDAYIDENGVKNLTSSVCDNYLLGYCSNVEVTNDGVFSKVELKKGTDVLATSYYYTESRVVEAIDLALASKSLNSTTLEDAVKSMVNDTNEQKKYTYVQGIEDGKVKYEVKYNGNTIYKKLEEKSIKDKLVDYLIENTSSSDFDAAYANLFISNINSNWKIASYRITYENNNYYQHRDVVEINTNEIIAKDVYEKSVRNNYNLTNELDSLKKKINVDKHDTSSVTNFTLTDKYYLKFKVYSDRETEQNDASYEDKCIISIKPDNNDSSDFEVYFDKKRITYKGAGSYYNNTYQKDTILNPIIMLSENNENYIIFNKTSLNGNITYKSYMPTGNKCSFELVEAYKYK